MPGSFHCEQPFLLLQQIGIVFSGFCSTTLEILSVGWTFLSTNQDLCNYTNFKTFYTIKKEKYRFSIAWGFFGFFRFIENGFWVKNKRRLMKHYIQEGTFKHDLAALIPTDIVRKYFIHTFFHDINFSNITFSFTCGSDLKPLTWDYPEYWKYLPIGSLSKD